MNRHGRAHSFRRNLYGRDRITDTGGVSLGRDRICVYLKLVRYGTYLPLHNICKHSRVSLRERLIRVPVQVSCLSVVIRVAAVTSWKWLAHVAK